MSDENISLELLGTRVLTLTAEVHEERMSAMLALVVRIAERVDGGGGSR